MRCSSLFSQILHNERKKYKRNMKVDSRVRLFKRVDSRVNHPYIILRARVLHRRGVLSWTRTPENGRSFGVHPELVNDPSYCSAIRKYCLWKYRTRFDLKSTNGVDQPATQNQLMAQHPTRWILSMSCTASFFSHPIIRLLGYMSRLQDPGPSAALWSDCQYITNLQLTLKW